MLEDRDDRYQSHVGGGVSKNTQWGERELLVQSCPVRTFLAVIWETRPLGTAVILQAFVRTQVDTLSLRLGILRRNGSENYLQIMYII